MSNFWNRLRGRGKYRLWPKQPQPKQPKTFYEFDGVFHSLYEEAMAATGTRGDRPLRRLRYYALARAAREACSVPGDACEIGCFRGMSAYLVASIFKAAGKSLTFHICDSFEGLSEPVSADMAVGGQPRVNPKPGLYSCSESDVRSHLARFDSLKFHKGWIPAPFQRLANERFCFAHIDVDLAEPTAASLEFVWPRMNSRGIVVFDDYGTMHYPGARRAIDAFFSGREDAVFLESPGGSGLAVKL